LDGGETLLVAKRLTRKEIVQEDAIRKTLTETSGWLFRNINYILMVAGLIIVIALTAFVWKTYQDSRDAEAQIAFSDALERFHAPVDEEDQANDPAQDPNVPDQQTKYRFTTSQERYEESLEAFRTVADDYSSFWLGEMSRYYAGLSLIKLDRAEDAKQELQKAIDEASWADVKNLARNALAQVAVAENNYEQAVQLYEQIVAEPSANLPVDMALLRLARNLELTGKRQEALSRYRQVTSEHAGSPSATAAQTEVRRLESLLGKDALPEEAPPDAEAEELDS
jgi:tetratricopeptide (TPR) repeat protein